MWKRECQNPGTLCRIDLAVFCTPGVILWNLFLEILIESHKIRAYKKEVWLPGIQLPFDFPGKERIYLQTRMISFIWPSTFDKADNAGPVGNHGSRKSKLEEQIIYCCFVHTNNGERQLILFYGEPGCFRGFKRKKKET